MAGKRDVRSLMRKQLGKDVADAMLNKVDKMVKRGATSAAIEKAFSEDLTAHIEKQVVSTVIAKIGPLTPLTVKPIQSSVKSTIAPSVGVSVKNAVTPSVKTTVSPAVGVKTGPGIYTKGSK